MRIMTLLENSICAEHIHMKYFTYAFLLQAQPHKNVHANIQYKKLIKRKLYMLRFQKKKK